MDHNRTPSLSFIGIVDFSDQARWLFMTDSVTDLLGYEPRELVGTPSLDLVHPDEFSRTKQIHYDTIQQDKAAVLLYLRMKHKIPSRGYILCGVQRTVVHNVLVGSVSLANPAKAMHNASTAQEVEVLSPNASNFQIRRWNDTSPTASTSGNQFPPPSSPSSSWNPRSSPGSYSSSDSEGQSPFPELRRQQSISFDHLPNQSLRTLFILDRFTARGKILYCSNDVLVTTLDAMGRSFYDFVHPRDESIVRNWIETVKSWGVNDVGQPSDGGFGYGRFTLLTKGRQSDDRLPDPGRHNSRSRPGRNRSSRQARDSGRGSYLQDRGHTVLPPIFPTADGPSPQTSVDAIFSAHSDGLMVVLRRSESD